MSSTSKAGMVWVRRSLAVLVMLGAMVVSYLVLGTWRQRSVAAERESSAASAPVNPFASANGVNLIAFVITASDCGWSTQPAAMDAAASIRKKLRSVYGDSYAQVSVVGVILDTDLQAGLRFLEELEKKGKPDAVFDQVSIGGSWLNEQIVQFVWRGRIATAISPQVIVVERPVNTESYLSASTIGVQGDRLVGNPTGTAEMVRWIDQGLPLSSQRGNRVAK